METSLTRLERCMARWCRTGDIRALGELFDLAAPELLRVAVHLSGDVASTEDLVQATFLKAIERRRSIDPARAGMGWLMHVLRSEAIDRIRRGGRERTAGAALDLEQLAGFVESADQPLQRRELSETVQRAVSELPEPYRKVVTLRLRHGATAPEIAELTETSAGAVRTQLHRGLAKLRELLPPSVAVALLGSMTSPASGLEALRSTVLGHAASLTPAASISATTISTSIATLTMTTKLLAACAIVLASVMLWTLQRDGTGPQSAEWTQQVTSQGAVVEVLEEHHGSAGSLAKIRSADELDRTMPTEDVPAVPLPFEVHARVVDAETEEPVPGALVEVFAARRVLPEEASAMAPECFELLPTGELRSASMQSWPIVRSATPASPFLREPILVGTVPQAGSSSLAATATDRDGMFTLSTPDGASLMRIRAEGYPDRMMSSIVTETQREESAKGDPGRIRVVHLHRDREYRGQVWGLEPEDFPIELAFAGHDDEGGAVATRLWTDDKGHFLLKAPASSLRPRSLTPGFRPKASQWLRPGTCVVPMMRDLLLRFVSDETGRPLERVRLRVEVEDGYARQAGEFVTDDGMVAFPAIVGRFGVDDNARLKVHAWAPGFEPAFVTVTEKDLGDTREVRLEPGSLAGVRGRVLMDGSPVERVVVELLSTDRLQWSRDTSYLMDAACTDLDGRFELEGPEGASAIRITSDLGSYLQEVQLPVRRPIDIDLASTASIAVQVNTDQGAVAENHVVVVRGTQGFQGWAETDADGVVTVRGLGPGTYVAMTPPGSVAGGFGGGIQESIELMSGEERVVEFVIPDANVARHVRISDGRSNSYEGWRARTSFVDWTDVRLDGTVPIDLNKPGYELRLHAPDGRRWRVRLPNEVVPDGHVLNLPSGEASLTGTVRRADGSPVEGIQVEARADGSTANLAARTGPDGGFHLWSVEPVHYLLSLRTRPEDAHDNDSDNPLRRYEFRMTEPAAAGTQVELVLAEAPKNLAVDGTVRSMDGAPKEGVFVAIVPTVAHGALEVTLPHERPFVTTGPDGQFHFETFRGDHLTVRIFHDGKAVQEQSVTVPVAGDLAPFDFVL